MVTPHRRLDELKHIARHAGVVLAGQLAVMAFGVTDAVVAARYSEAALATLSVGTAVCICVYVGLMGILQALKQEVRRYQEALPPALLFRLIAVTPLLVYGLLLWGLGLSGGYMLAYHGAGPWPAQFQARAF